MSIGTYGNWGNGMSEQQQQQTKHAYVMVPGVNDYRGVVITGGEKVKALVTGGSADNQTVLDEREFDETAHAVDWCANWLRGTR